MSAYADPESPLMAYYQVCLAHPALVRRIERLLGESRAQIVSVRGATDALVGQGATYDQVSQALAALHAAGILLAQEDGTYAINSEAYLKSLPARLGALEALSWVGETPSELAVCELLVAIPPGAVPPATGGHQARFSDLRTAVRAMIAEVNHRVLLAAPYWDVEIATDLAELLRRRIEAGVQVAILSRKPQSGSTNERALATVRGKLRDTSACQIRILEQPSEVDPFGSTTFHFKAACCDGTRAYLGSANFNTAGLASRWELGVRLEGARARVISELVETLFSAARPW